MSQLETRKRSPSWMRRWFPRPRCSRRPRPHGAGLARADDRADASPGRRHPRSSRACCSSASASPLSSRPRVSRARDPLLTPPCWWLLAAGAAFVGRTRPGGSGRLDVDAAEPCDARRRVRGGPQRGASGVSPVRRQPADRLALLRDLHRDARSSRRRSATPSWLFSQIWTRVTRPYLQITHLNNAYHFYAPEPGPVAIVWFRVRFADGAVAWVRCPDHAKCANHVERRRMGGIATTLAQSVPVQPTEEQIRRRDEAAQRYDPALPPRPPGCRSSAQYRDPGRSAGCSSRAWPATSPGRRRTPAGGRARGRRQGLPRRVLQPARRGLPGGPRSARPDAVPRLVSRRVRPAGQRSSSRASATCYTG